LGVVGEIAILRQRRDVTHFPTYSHGGLPKILLRQSGQPSNDFFTSIHTASDCLHGHFPQAGSISPHFGENEKKFFTELP
jgi:hypothetical protein